MANLPAEHSLQAWGPLGHSAIGAIAEKHLWPATQSHIAALLARGHDADLPLGANDYREFPAFTSVNDVVHAIKGCIAVLEKAENRADDFTKPQALRLLVHFVGDIHQPLHCGTGFYDLSNFAHPVLITDPRLCFGKPNDGKRSLFGL